MSCTKIASPLAGQVIGSVTDAFVIAEWRDPGGPPGSPRLIAPPHLHRTDDEAWFVLAGTLCVQVGKEEVEAHTGSAVFHVGHRTRIGIRARGQFVICWS